jgi:hypothetical protein
MNMTKKQAKRESGIDKILQISHLQFQSARKTGSGGFRSGSGGFQTGCGGFRTRSGGFQTGSNALRICIPPAGRQWQTRIRKTMFHAEQKLIQSGRAAFEYKEQS